MSLSFDIIKDQYVDVSFLLGFIKDSEKKYYKYPESTVLNFSSCSETNFDDNEIKLLNFDKTSTIIYSSRILLFLYKNVKDKKN